MTAFSRRSLFAAPLLGLAAPALAQTPAQAGPNLAIVMNSGSATLSEIDMSNGSLVREVPTLREPSHWALTPDRARLIIADAGGNSFFFIDPVSGAALGHRVIPDPYQLWFSPDQKYLTVNCLRINRINVYHAADLTLAQKFATGSMPSHLAYSPDSQFVFNTLQGANALNCYDLNAMKLRWSVPVGKTPAGVLWHRGQLLVAIMGADYVAVVDPHDGRVLRKITTDRGAHNLFLTPDGREIYVTNRVGGSLTVLDAARLTPKAQIKMAGGPDDLGFAPDGKIWICLRFAEKIAVYTPATGAIDHIAVGRSPHGIFLNTLLTDKPARAALAIG
ncbi:MAG TPA: beta-propeller fold lactonase family protein [Acetobacteraceae bacterium]|nr:beta-propeller fold lactonase family protein [Acetobacteraceae bacterium]